MEVRVSKEAMAETKTWWKSEEVFVMLAIVNELNVAPVLNSKSQRNAAVFNAVAHRMKTKGYQRTGEQVRNKWKNMKKEYYSLKKKCSNQHLPTVQPKYFHAFEALLESGSSDGNCQSEIPAVTDPRSILECVIDSPPAQPSEDGDDQLSDSSSSSSCSEDTTAAFDQPEAGSSNKRTAHNRPAVSNLKSDLLPSRKKRHRRHSCERALSYYHKLYTDFTQKLWEQHRQWEVEERRQRNQETIQLAQGLVQALLPLLAQTRSLSQEMPNLAQSVPDTCPPNQQVKPEPQEPSSSLGACPADDSQSTQTS